MNSNSIPFYDGYWYCYANSTAMMLAAGGEQISPHLIEPLTGVGLGSHISSRSGLPFLSGAAGEPDVGISKALDILGFKFEEKNRNEGEAPFVELEAILPEGPVVIGPLDMSYLDYNPDRPRFEGVDHFILVYQIEGDRVYVNDPAGYAQVFIQKTQLAKAWKAEKISYKRGLYRYWAKPVRVEQPTEEQIYHKAMSWFAELYAKAAKEKQQGALVNGEAIRKLKEMMATSIQENQLNFLTGFALPLGVKRALDYAAFFKEHNSSLTELKLEQAELLGKAQSLLMNKKTSELGEVLDQLTSTEDALEKAILSI